MSLRVLCGSLNTWVSAGFRGVCEDLRGHRCTGVLASPFTSFKILPVLVLLAVRTGSIPNPTNWKSRQTHPALLRWCRVFGVQQKRDISLPSEQKNSKWLLGHGSSPIFDCH